MQASALGVLRPWISQFLKKVAAAPGTARATSWGRTVAHNAAVGGAPDSQHLIYCAADFVPIPPSTNATIAQALRSQGLTVIDEGDHVHAQLWPGSVGGAVVRAMRDAGLLS